MAQLAEALGHTATTSASMDNNVLAIVIAASEWRAGAPAVPERSGGGRPAGLSSAGASRAVPIRDDAWGWAGERSLQQPVLIRGDSRGIGAGAERRQGPAVPVGSTEPRVPGRPERWRTGVLPWC